MRRFVVFAVLISCVLSTAMLRAEQNVKAEPNAALLYWQAVALLPEFTDAQKELLHKTPHDKYATFELDDTAKELIESTGMSISMFRRGAKIRQCNWGLTLEDGAATLLPHVGKMRTLARLATLHARHSLDYEGARIAKKDIAAVENLAAVIQLSRHIGVDDLLITHLVQNAFERIATDVIALNTFRLHPEAVGVLLARLNSLAPAHSIGAAVIGEKHVFVGSMKQNFTGANAEQEFRNMLFMYGDDLAVQRIKKKVPDVVTAVKLLDDLAKRYDEIAEFSALPPNEFSLKWEEMLEQVEKENVLAAIFLPSIGVAHEHDAMATTRREMLKVALHLAVAQVEAAKNIKDPFGDAGFELNSAEKGEMVISSKLTIKETPFSMTFRKP